MRKGLVLLLAMLVTSLVACSNGRSTRSAEPKDGAGAGPRPVHVLNIAASDAVFDIPFLDDFALTAAPSQWAERGFNVEIMDAYKLRLDADDFSVAFRLGWDADGLLIFANVVDDQLGLATDDASLWSGNGDQMAIYITPEQGAPCARIAVGPAAESGDTAPVILFTPPFEPGTARPTPVRAAFESFLERTDHGYALALKIPWSDLDIAPQDGLELGLQVLFQDADGGGVHRWYPEFGAGGDSTQTYRIRLATAPPRPVTVVMDRIAHISDGSTWITASAPIECAGDRLQIMDGDTLLTEVDLVADGSGYARARVILDEHGAHPFPLYTPHNPNPPTLAAPMKAGVASRDITLLDCLSGEQRAVDPLFGKVLVIEDPSGTRIAILSLDQLVPDLPKLRERMKNELGIQHTFSNSSHTHSVARPSRTAEWYSQTEQLLWDAAVEATSNMTPVTLRAGRAPVEIGYNRNREQFSRATVPWVNVLVVNRIDEPAPMAILFEYGAHPVVTQDAECISADYPAYAAARIREQLGDDVVPLFVQGCGGSANAWPAGFDCDAEWDVRANKAGEKLGDAVLDALADTEELPADTFTVRHKDIELPCQLPSPEQLAATHARLAEQDPPWHTRESWERSLDVVEGMMDRGESPAWPAHVDAVMLGDSWCLIAMPGEVYAEYELWIERQVGHPHKMVLAYTNGPRGHYYIPPDEALALGIAEPLVAERACNWAASWPAFFSGVPIDGAMLPLAPGTEKIIQNAIIELTTEPPTPAAEAGRGDE